MRLLKRILLLLLVVVASWWLLSRFNIIPSFGDLFTEKKVVIDQTATLIKDIKPLAQLVTLSAYDEIVVDSTINMSPGIRVIEPLMPLIVPPSIYQNKAIVIIGKTITHVGINLEKLKPEDIRISQDSVYLTLPKAQVLDVILNPSDVEIFIERGNWDNTTIATLKNQIGAIAVQHTEEKGLLAESEKKAVEIMTAFFAASGKKVIIDFK